MSQKVTTEILICRDAKTGLTEQDCLAKGLSYDEFADIEVEVTGNYHCAIAGRRVDGARFAEPHEEAHVSDLVAVAKEGYAFFQCGEEIQLTPVEEAEAQEKFYAEGFES